jgi:hypothetical protein
MCFTVTATFHHSRTSPSGGARRWPQTLPSTTADRTVEEARRPRELSPCLLGSAAKKSYDPVVDIDWDAPVPTHLYGLSPEWSTLYGTPLWDSSSHDQRVTLPVHEYCSISGVGIRFECLLRQLVLRDNLWRGPGPAARPATTPFPSGRPGRPAIDEFPVIAPSDPVTTQAAEGETCARSW